jgi:chromosome segregation ATPase
MNEDSTKELSHRRSFEERVFARFDTIDARLEKLEARNYDTKPIWEKALAAIMETGLEVGVIKTKVEVIEDKVGVIEDKVGVIEDKVGVIEGKVGVIEGKVNTIETELAAMRKSVRDELVDVRRELKHYVGAKVDMILKVVIEDRDDIRDAEERIRELERKSA